VSWHNTSVLEGSNVLFRATIRNQGTVATPVNAPIRVDFRADNQLVSWSDSYTSSLARGATITIQADNGPDGNALWDDVAPGNWSIQAAVDSSDRIPESNETNNTFRASLLVESSTSGNLYAVTLTPNLTDATTREANRAAIANAIATVGAAGGGVVLLPAGHFYIQQQNITTDTAAIVIDRDNITLRGQGIGKTVLHSRSAWQVVNSQVIRGHGISIIGTQNAQAPRKNVLIEQLELDGGASWTGNYGWPANTTTGDGWDITHKGILLSVDACGDDLTVRDVYVHSYRGEVLYTGGWRVVNMTIERVWSADSNASALNTFATNMQVRDCQFGGTIRFWQEWAQTNFNTVNVLDNCTFYDSRDASGGIAISDISGTAAITFSNCRFITSNWGAFGIYGNNDGSGIDIHIEDSYFENHSRCVGLNAEQGPNPNKGVNFLRNKIINCSYMLLTYGGPQAVNHLYDSNDFSGRGGNTMCYLGKTAWTGCTVSNNTWRNAGSEYVNAGGNTGFPVFSNNFHGSLLNDVQAPTTPTGLNVVAGSPLGTSHRAWLTWNASTDNVGVSGYYVYRNGVQVAVARHRWWLDTGLAGGTPYTYTVSAFDAAGNESAQSQVVQVRTPSTLA
jgi:hypothetical protein